MLAVPDNLGFHEVPVRRCKPMTDTFNIESFSKLMQLSVSPVVLISAVGLLLLSVTNRLGRTIDRSRITAREIDLKEGIARQEPRSQLIILMRRAALLRLSVTLLVASIFFSCLMILFLFLRSFWGMRMEMVVIGLFFLNLLSLLGSISYLLADVFLSLRALRIEVAHHTR